MRNIFFNVSGYMFTIIASFVVRTVFIKTLNTEYLGINGLFSNILNVLSLAELGVGNAIMFNLYKPVAERNEQKIRELMHLFKNAYRIIAASVMVIGLGMLPFLKFMIMNPPQIKENLYIIYLLYLLNSSSSYLFIYKKSLLIVDQKQYIADIIGYGYTFFMNVGQVILLLMTHNFYAYLMIQIVSGILQNIIISIVCDRRYHYLKYNHEVLPKEEKSNLFRNMRALVLYKISGIINNNTDNLIISAFLGTIWVGVYSNYYMIIHSVYSILKLALTAVSASIGNLNVTSSEEKKQQVFNITSFSVFWLYGLFSVGIFVLINPFIEMWIGTDYLLDTTTVAFLVANFYLMGFTQTYNVYRNTLGLFVQGQLRPIISVIVNIGFSLFLVQLLGITGVFIGTLISYLSVNIWFDPLIIHRYGFKKPVMPFYFRNLLYIFVVIGAIITTSYILSFVVISNILLSFCFKFVICFIITNGLFFIVFSRTEEFRHLLQIINHLFIARGIIDAVKKRSGRFT